MIKSAENIRFVFSFNHSLQLKADKHGCPKDVLSLNPGKNLIVKSLRGKARLVTPPENPMKFGGPIEPTPHALRKKMAEGNLCPQPW